MNGHPVTCLTGAEGEQRYRFIHALPRWLTPRPDL